MLFIIGIGLFGIAIGFNANVLDPFTYNEKVRLLAPPGIRNTTLGFITIMALIMALVAQPLVGQWSDRTHNRWGRRIPYLSGGSVGLAFALALLVLADNLLLLIVGAMLVSACANTVQAAWQALIPDYVTHRQHGTAAGAKTVMEIIGVVAGIAVVGYFLARGNMWAGPLVTSLLFFIILGLTIVTLSGASANNNTLQPTTAQNSLAVLLKAVKDAPTPVKWWMVNRFLFWSSAISIRTFLLNYLEDVHGLAPSEAQALTSRMLLVLGAGVFLLALPSGAVADKVGRKPILIVAGLLAAGGSLLFAISADLNMLFVAGGLVAVGAGIFASASWALATDLAPKAHGALYLALANAATVVGSIGGRLGGPLIDGLNSAMGTIALGYVVDFGIAALFFAASSLIVLKIK